VVGQLLLERGRVLTTAVGTRGSLPKTTLDSLRQIKINDCGSYTTILLLALRHSIEIYHTFMDYNAQFTWMKKLCTREEQGAGRLNGHPMGVRTKTSRLRSHMNLFTHIYTHTHIYIYIYIYIYTHTYIYIHTHTQRYSYQEIIFMIFAPNNSCIQRYTVAPRRAVGGCWQNVIYAQCPECQSQEIEASMCKRQEELWSKEDTDFMLQLEHHFSGNPQLHRRWQNTSQVKTLNKLEVREESL
jgi:hypothetical protein